MFSSFSFLPKDLHEVISVYIFMYALIMGAYVYATFHNPYSVRPMSLKYLPESFINNLLVVVMTLIYGWMGYAIGEWVVIFTVISFPVLLTVMVFEYTRLKDPDLFNALTIGSLLFTVSLTLILYQDKIGTFGN